MLCEQSLYDFCCWRYLNLWPVKIIFHTKSLKHGNVFARVNMSHTYCIDVEETVVTYDNLKKWTKTIHDELKQIDGDEV